MKLTDFQLSLASVYAFVRAEEENQAIASLTLDNLITDQIDRLKGTAKNIYNANHVLIGVRQSQYDTLTQLGDQIDAMVQAVNNAGSDPAKLSLIGLTPESKDPGVT